MPNSEPASRLNGPMVARLRGCAADTSPNWDGKITIYPPEARDLIGLIDEARPNHVITVSPTGTEPGHFHDWACSCGEASKFFFSDFGLAAGGAVVHVPGDQTLVITRPYVAGGEQRG